MTRVPAEEPPQWTQHRAGVAGVKAPTTGEAGTVHQKGPAGPSGPELTAVTFQYLTTHKPEAQDSKVEKQFRALGREIIWTSPYCPKFQPIEFVWGIGKQRAGTLHRAGRTREATRRHLRRGWYGGKGKEPRALCCAMSMGAERQQKERWAFGLRRTCSTTRESRVRASACRARWGPL